MFVGTALPSLVRAGENLNFLRASRAELVEAVARLFDDRDAPDVAVLVDVELAGDVPLDAHPLQLGRVGGRHLVGSRAGVRK